MYEARQHVSIFQAEVVVRTKHVGRDHRRVASSILLIIPSAKHTEELSVSVNLPKIKKVSVLTG